MEVAARRLVFEGQGEVLKPYVPRLLVEWVRDAPDTRYHAREATLAFVDISGFTALTERLASRGKIGAEVLRDTLDGVFTALLDEAYAWGAGLLKWGGDALLLMFDGEGHGERAARAAWEMQRTIERVGRIRVGSGVVTLRMSIGVATGTVEFFTAGSLHRELLVVGPLATETVLLEAAANAGEIALSPQLAAALRPWAGREKDGVVLLAASPEAVPARAPDVGAVDADAIASCIPVAARAHVLLERSEPEHRVITAAFVDLMDTDVLLDRLGPAAFGEALDERISWIEEVADRYQVPFNVTDVSKGAVKVLLSAGAPSSTGHDEEQALRMAREIMDRPGVIPMRIGINTGRVFTGDFGPPYRRTYAVLGDTINTAARVMARAEAGQILATDEVLERSRTLFETAAIEPFQAKGKTEPVRASLVGPIVGRRGERLAETAFVGRERELGALAAVLDDVRDGNGWTIEIAGPSGIGKTRLLRELFSAAPDVRVMRSTCEEYEASTPYYGLRRPVRDLLGLRPAASAGEEERRLREVVAATEPELEPWLPLLGILLGLHLPPTPETAALDERFLREVLADVTLRLFTATSGGAPTALVVEDAQFVDDASDDLLRRLAGTAGSLPLLLVVARTQTGTAHPPASDDDRRVLAFDLLPLPESAATELVQLATDAEPLRPHEIDELARRSGGSPLFLIELLNVARSTGSTKALPDSVEAVVTADIDRLSPSDRMVLRYASVAGVSFNEMLLAATLQDEIALDEPLWSRLRGLVDRDSTGVLRFRNTLVHDVAYEGLPFRRRRELHARVAEAIEKAASSLEDEAATLALHYSAARRRDKTWWYGRLGGDRARSVAAHVEAARLYELALSAGRFVRAVDSRARADVLVALGTVRETAGLFEDSYEAFRRATRLLVDDPVEQAWTYVRRARDRQRMGAHSLALRDTAAGLRLVEGREEPYAVRARALLRAWRAEIFMFQGHAGRAIPLAEIAVDEAKEVDEFEALAHAYTALDGSYQLLGQPEKAVHERMALEMYQQLGNARLAGIYGLNVGVQAYADGRWDEARDLYLRAQGDCLRAGDRQHAAHLGSSLAELLISRGELDEAERLLAESRRVLRSSGFVYAIFADIQIGRLALDRGDVEGALATLSRIEREAEAVGYAALVLEIAVYKAHAHARLGAPQAGLDALDAAVAAVGDEAVLYTAAIERARAACFAALGRPDDAQVCLDVALAAAVDQRQLYEQLLARRARFELAGASGEELREIDRLAQLLGIAIR